MVVNLIFVRVIRRLPALVKQQFPVAAPFFILTNKGDIMNETTSISIGLIGLLIGCFVGLAGWLAGRDKRISTDAEWRGSINSKLDMMLGIQTKSDKELSCLQGDVKEHGEKISALDQSCKQAHLRIDRLEGKKGQIG